MNIEYKISNDEVSNQGGMVEREITGEYWAPDKRQEKRKYDLEERLIEFGILIIQVSESVNYTSAGKHIAGQIVRSGTSPALHYGEAQSAESRKDFIHKLKILLKELRETLVGLKMIRRVPLSKRMDIVEKGLQECNELISIFNKSIETAENNGRKEGEL